MFIQGEPWPTLPPLPTPMIRRALFGLASSVFDLKSRRWSTVRLLNLCGVPSRPSLQNVLGSTTNKLFLMCLAFL